ncbi:DUF6417 family protein [Streptomyces sp. NPDC003487]
MDALRVYTNLAPVLRVAPADGLVDRVRTAYFDRPGNRWRMTLTTAQIDSVAYAFYLRALSGSVAEANWFAREYGITYRSTGQPAAPAPYARGRTPQPPDRSDTTTISEGRLPGASVHARRPSSSSATPTPARAARTMITVTARRNLGTGPEAPAHGIRAAQADLLDALPDIHLLDLNDLRTRGVLGTTPAAPPSPRRVLGTGSAHSVRDSSV